MTDSTMKYCSLGRCGTKVSIFGFGSWTTIGGSVTDSGVIKALLHTAFDAGINFFDTADIYARGEAEAATGKVLKDFPRHELVVSTKVFWPMSDNINDRGLSRKHIRESIDKSLRRLGMDYVDIYFCHRFDAETPVEETAHVMDDLVRAGKIIYWGTSEWTGTQIRGLHDFCERKNLYAPRVEQPQYSLLSRVKFENDIRPAAIECGMGLVVWSPLASGLLTGKYDKGIPADSRLARIDWLREDLLTDDRIAKVRTFKNLADRLGHSRSQIALAWTIAQEGVSSVILGATNVEQLRENLATLSLELSNEDLRKIAELFASR